MIEKELCKSPLNYVGGKYRLLEQILPLFPKKIEKFYDIFCGGCNVAVNVDSNSIVANDINHKIISLYKFFQDNEKSFIFKQIENIINHYELSRTDIYKYEHYNCKSSEGLSSYNKEKYKNIKSDYNNNKMLFDENLIFYVLIVYGFNNQIRFNKKNEYNMPVGKRDFNKNIQKNLSEFIDVIHKKKIVFTDKSYSDIEIENNGFIYVDPPYLITIATYNESDGWNDKKEIDLLNYLKEQNDKGIKFALSNVIEHKGIKNEILINWVRENNYNIHYLNHSYSNSSYQLKDKVTPSIEVLITNY
jgi:site-specific DNA-adenine methylase